MPFPTTAKRWLTVWRAAGSDWQQWHFRDVATGKDLPDVLDNIKFSGASWTKDDKGVFYSRYPGTDEKSRLTSLNFNQKIYYHKLGTNQSEDAMIYERPDDKEMNVGGSVTEDGKYLIIYVTKGTSPNTMIYYKDLSSKNAPVMPIVDRLENAYDFVGNVGSTFYFKTDQDAPRGRIVAADVNSKDKSWKEIIPQAKETIDGLSFVNDEFVVNYLKDAYTQVKIYDRDGKFVRDVELPGIGTADGFGGKRGDTETFYSYNSFIAPPTIYRYDLKTGKSEVFRQADVKFDFDQYETKQVFYASKDGTKVPMFIVYKKGLKLDGTNPTLLYGYGGFSISLTPTFSVSRLVWLEMGGVYAMANLRGGAEYGEEWHKAGTKLHKQNVFDDFIGAAEYLIKEKYTSPAKLAIQGGSNGGFARRRGFKSATGFVRRGTSGGRRDGYASF